MSQRNRNTDPNMRREDPRCNLRLCRFDGVSCPLCGRPVFKQEESEQAEEPLDHGI